MTARYRMFAGYNAWCNERLYDAASRVSDADYRADRGAFFKSLHGTLNHLLVGDRIWMQRFTGEGEVPNSLDEILYDDFAALRAARRAEDEAISRYIESLSAADLTGTIRFRTFVRPADRRAALATGARSFLQPPDPPPRPGARAVVAHDRQRGDALLRPDHLSARDRCGFALILSFRGARAAREPGIQGPKHERCCVALDSGFRPEPAIGPRFARTRWAGPGMTGELARRSALGHNAAPCWSSTTSPSASRAAR